MRRLAALVVLALAIAGCGSPTTEGATGGSAPAAPSTGGGTGTAPFGTVDAVAGGQIDGAELAGRDLALWFWAPW